MAKKTLTPSKTVRLTEETYNKLNWLANKLPWSERVRSFDAAVVWLWKGFDVEGKVRALRANQSVLDALREKREESND